MSVNDGPQRRYWLKPNLAVCSAAAPTAQLRPSIWVCLYYVYSFRSQCHWLRAARDPVQLSDSIHDERQLYLAISMIHTTVQAAYVTLLARHLEVFPNSNNPTQVLPTGTALTNGSGATVLRHPAPLVYPAASCGIQRLKVYSVPRFRQGRQLPDHLRKQYLQRLADESGKTHYSAD